jgi:apolipoprotein D and lipocalin family protein
MNGILATALLAAWLLSFPAAPSVAETGSPEPTPLVNLERYMGKWYEIARLPMWFQRGCIHSWATYTLVGAQKVTVHNECTTDKGMAKSAKGIATVLDTVNGSKLEVVFDNWFSRLFPFLSKGKYWIFHIDRDYQHAIVGHPNRRYLWILSRSPEMDDATYTPLVRIAEELGFDTKNLLRSRPGRER